jgi:hypothetical protein
MKQLYPVQRLALTCILLLSSVFSLNTVAQCTSCSYTYPGTFTGQALTGGQTVCFESDSYTYTSLSVSGSNNICVKSGATLNWSQSVSEVTINVYGTLVLQRGGFASTRARINVYNGGKVTVAANVSNLSRIIFDIRNGGTMDVLNTGTVNVNYNSAIINAGVVNANTPSLVVFNDYSGLDNNGTINFKNLTLYNYSSLSVNGVPRRNKGTINIGGLLTWDGDLDNTSTGSINVAGPVSYTSNAVNIGYKTAYSYINNGCLKVDNGGVYINVALVHNGNLIIRKGDLFIDAHIAGTNGKIRLLDGWSEISASGSFSGTNQKFFDTNTPGNDFDRGSTAGTGYAVSSTVPGNCDNGTTLLPVTLALFEAQYTTDERVFLQWKTTYEQNLSRFVLQASADGRNYYDVQTIAATNSANGNQYQSARYSKSQYAFYRLATIGNDGKAEYSRVVKINAGARIEFSLFPNPITGNSFTIEAPNTNPVIVQVFSTDGRMVYNNVLKGMNRYQVTLPATALQQKNLIVELVSDGQARSYKMMVQQ